MSQGFSGRDDLQARRARRAQRQFFVPAALQTLRTKTDPPSETRTIAHLVGDASAVGADQRLAFFLVPNRCPLEGRRGPPGG